MVCGNVARSCFVCANDGGFVSCVSYVAKVVRFVVVVWYMVMIVSLWHLIMMVGL